MLINDHSAVRIFLIFQLSLFLCPAAVAQISKPAGLNFLFCFHNIFNSFTLSFPFFHFFFVYTNYRFNSTLLKYWTPNNDNFTSLQQTDKNRPLPCQKTHKHRSLSYILHNKYEIIMTVCTLPFGDHVEPKVTIPFNMVSA